MFFGMISEKNRMDMAIQLDTLSRIFSSSGQMLTARPPTMVAPSVLAMVFRLRIAELVVSSWVQRVSSISPRAGCTFFRPSISAVVVLRTMASNMEQSAETPMVKAIAKMNAEIIIGVLDARNVGAPEF